MAPTRPSVLCVDDDRDVVELLSAILEDEGYAVSSLYDFDEDALMRLAQPMTNGYGAYLLGLLEKGPST